ncbi:endonuclease V [Candidatus Woesearchaeota archaeon]|nr:endonuclease V [Candidatus Woesearchaeota archaeon]
MVRINLINPKKLADQHLIAEYNEILMLLGYIRKHPRLKDIPNDFHLGKGHMLFFKNKLGYIKNRFESVKKEMQRRNFHASKNLNLSKFSINHLKNWKPKIIDIKLIKKRIRYKIKLKPGYYRYFGKKKNKLFFLKLLK